MFFPVGCFCILILFLFSVFFKTSLIFRKAVAQSSSVVRGLAGDLWADLVIGKRDFGEIAPKEIVSYKVSAPGGTIVDRSVNPGRLYVWDSGNSRILGLDLANCYSQTSPCRADIVIGQPSVNDYGACNLDASFQTYPNRPPASASTICGIPETTATTLEDKTFTSMYVDGQGNLYVADSFNHRVLKFNSPFTTDRVADEVWGQTDFSGNGCNLTGGVGNGYTVPPLPTSSSFCFHTIGSHGSGVTLDSTGNLWVADGGNNRVLRFSKNQQTGVISKTADLVLGQPNFTSGGDWSRGSDLNRMHAPSALRFDANGKLYVADTANNRILTFSPPFTSGMNGTVFVSGLNNPLGIEIDPAGRGIFTYDTSGPWGRVQLWSFDGSKVITQFTVEQVGGGSIGIDAKGNLLPSAYVYGQDVYRFVPQTDGSYVQDKRFFTPPYGYNLTSNKRLEHPGFVGVGIAGSQLIVTDNRLLFWNNLSSLANGKPADGYVDSNSFTDLPNPGFEQLKVDSDNRVWVAKFSEVRLYQAPLAIGASPVKTITSPLSVLGGGQINFTEIHGLAPTKHSEFLWMADTVNHRVLRVRSPLTNPLVDIVLGQTDLVGKECNRGLIPAPNTGTSLSAELNMLCYPGALSIDKKGNFYISDHFLEANGNFRLLMFSSSLFPTNNTGVLYALSATKSFPRTSSTNPYSHMVFEPSFNSANRMVIGHNPYSGKRFVDYYNDPTIVNPNDPSDPNFAKPDGSLNDFYGWPVAATFDSSDNLYVYDANRGQVRIYKTPLPGLPSPSPTPTPTLKPTPTLTPTATPTITPSPTPIPTMLLSKISATNITNSSAQIQWISSQPGTSRVAYGKSSNNLKYSTSLDSNMVTAHKVNLSGLKRRTKYYYKVFSKNQSGTEFGSGVYSFTTSLWQTIKLNKNNN